MPDQDRSVELLASVSDAVRDNSPLHIAGNESKSFLGNAVSGTPLNVAGHSGVIAYEPTELVIKARCGTPVKELELLLSQSEQMMPFEPPVFADNDTLGGVIACGLSGPRRPYAGSARDFVLGMGIINGRAEQLSFGGEVMKNVAGYDVSRLHVGAMGTLGAILEVSMKVLPLPETELTLQWENETPNDVSKLIKLARQPLPVSASAVMGKQCWIRLSGSEPSVRSAARTIGGDQIAEGDGFWRSLRDHTHPYFSFADDNALQLWRISVADYAPSLTLDGEWLYEWGGSQRWLKTSAPADEVFAACAAARGHATRYRGGDTQAPAFQPLEGALKSIHRSVRLAFDPAGLFNPGRYHNEF